MCSAAVAFPPDPHSASAAAVVAAAAFVAAVPGPDERTAVPGLQS